MHIIFNSLIPVKGFVAMNLFGLVFARKDCKDKITDAVLNHEAIHTAQMKELLYIGFYVIYLLEWFYRLIFHTKTAYRGISFEVEAKAHQYDLGYLSIRKHYSMWR